MTSSVIVYPTLWVRPGTAGDDDVTTAIKKVHLSESLLLKLRGDGGRRDG